MPASSIECPVRRDGSHRYWLGGRELISVTEILTVGGLKPPYRSDPDPETGFTPAERGNAADLAVTELLYGRDPYAKLTEQGAKVAKPYVESWINWDRMVGGVDLVAAHIIVWCPLLGTAGEIDWLLKPRRSKDNRELWLADGKTGTMPKAYVSIQLAGYADMLRSCYRDQLGVMRIASNVCVLLTDSGKPESSDFDDHKYFNVWRGLVSAYWHKRDFGLISRNGGSP